MTKSFKIIYEVVVTGDDDVSMNNATDAVSYALFQLGSDGELVQTIMARLVEAEELHA